MFVSRSPSPRAPVFTWQVAFETLCKLSLFKSQSVPNSKESVVPFLTSGEIECESFNVSLKGSEQYLNLLKESLLAFDLDCQDSQGTVPFWATVSECGTWQ
ncbi:uncharacterized protein LOC142557868 [Dermacentor variabilis]|uniref:uncharacterized protein LOC142557868 n=1 Tax=Dermacentor variabilis TaxID=34621 RepID=UPI003F5C8316